MIGWQILWFINWKSYKPLPRPRRCRRPNFSMPCYPDMGLQNWFFHRWFLKGSSHLIHACRASSIEVHCEWCCILLRATLTIAVCWLSFLSAPGNGPKLSFPWLSNIIKNFNATLIHYQKNKNESLGRGGTKGWRFLKLKKRKIEPSIFLSLNLGINIFVGSADFRIFDFQCFGWVTGLSDVFLGCTILFIHKRELKVFSVFALFVWIQCLITPSNFL